MNFECHVNTVYRKAHQCVHFYQNLYGGFLCWWFLWEQLFLHSHFFWWYKLLNMKNKNRLKSIVKVCSKISGITLNVLHYMRWGLWKRPTHPVLMHTLSKAQSYNLLETTGLSIPPCWLENGCWKLLAVHRWNWRVL